jgi:hypothetical protein
MPTPEEVRQGVRKGLQKIIAQHGLKKASDLCGLPESMIQGMLSDDTYQWLGVGASERIAKALGITLDMLTAGKS